MTQQQKNILILLAVADLIFICCLLPAVAFVATQPEGTNPVQMAMDTVQGFMPVTPTRRPTATPTRVLSPTPTPTLEPGWKLYPVDKDSFAIIVPASWNSMTIDPNTINSQLDSLAKNNPTIANILKAQGPDMIAKMRFVGVETDSSVTASGFAPNVNVVHDIETAGLTLNDVIELSKKELAAQKITPTINKITTLAGEMVEFKFTMPMTLLSKQTVNLSAVQYVILRGQDSYSISCVALDKQAVKYTPLCEKIGKGFRWTK